MRVSALSHATEDREKVARAILWLCPEGFPRKLESSKIKGHYGNEIVLLRIRASGASGADQFLAQLWTRLSSLDRRRVLSMIESQVDPSGVLHLRIDKQECFNGRVVLNDPDPVKIEVQFSVRESPQSSLPESIRERLSSLPTHNPLGKSASTSSMAIVF